MTAELAGTLSVLVNALVDRSDTREAAQLAGLVALAIVAEAALYPASDGLYARNAGHLYRDAGTLARARRGEDTSGLPSRFISAAETLERATLSILNSGSMLLVEFASALVALATLEPWALPVVAPLPGRGLRAAARRRSRERGAGRGWSRG